MTKRPESATVASPPGATIRDILAERGITIEEFAPRIGLDPRRMQDLLDGSLLLGKKLSRRLAYQLGSTPEFWLQRENNYRASINAVIDDSVREPDKRGGKRKGAGRPAGTPNPKAGRRITKMTAGARVPESGLSVNVTARISENAYAAIAACCATDRISQSDFLRDAIYARLDAIYPKWNQ